MFVLSHLPRKVVGLLVAALAVTFLTIAPQPAQAAGVATLSGTVTASDTGLPLADVYVGAYGPGGGGAVTDAAGHWQIAGIPAGQYSLYFSVIGRPYHDRYWGGDGTAEQEVLVSATAGATTSGLNLALSWFPSVSGTVAFSEGGGGTGCLFVDLVNIDGETYEGEYSWVDEDGAFAIDTSNVLPGRYTILVSDVQPEGVGCRIYAQRYLGDVYNLNSAATFYLNTGGVVTGKDVTLEVGATISGTVTGSNVGDTGGMTGSIYATNDEDLAHPELGQSRSVTSNAADGSYEISGLQPGDYTVEYVPDVDGCDAGYRPQWYGGAKSPWTASPLTLVAGQGVIGADVQFTQNGAPIVGHVSGSDTGTGVAGVGVTVMTSDGKWLSQGFGFGPNCGELVSHANLDFGPFFDGPANGPQRAAYEFPTTSTDANGDFTLPAMPDGQYTLRFGDDSTYAAQFLGGAAFIETATPLTVSSSAPVDVGTVTLNPGASISGNIAFDGTSTDHHERYVTAMAFAQNPTTGAWELVKQGPAAWVTGEAGFGYTIPGLAPGTYKVGFFDYASRGGGYAPEFFGDSVTLAGASDVVVTAGAVTPSIDVTLSAVGPVESQRFAGAGRFETSVAMSQEYAPGVPAVYIASGANFPDALAAAPAAAAQGVPLLLVTSSSIPSVVLTELQRLNPASIVVVGGNAAVSPEVYTQLSDLTPSIKRLFGADRFATARAIIEDYWPAGSAPLVYAASGLNFPDALSAAAAAGAKGTPVLTVNGGGAALDQQTKDLLTYLGTKEVAIAGGIVSVSATMQASFAALPGMTDVWRYAGANRYATGAAINHDAFTASDTVYLASGKNFPDALSGAALAGRDKAPLYIIPGECVPAPVLADITALGAKTIRILGGTSAVSVDLAHVTVCA